MTNRPLAQADQARAEIAQLREALAVILDALDIPYAATAADAEIREDVLEKRVALAKQTLRHLLPETGVNVGLEIGLLRDQLAEHPPTYVTDVQAQAARAAGASYEESVQPTGPPAADPPAPGIPDRGGWGADVPAYASAGVLRRVAVLIEGQTVGIDLLSAFKRAAFTSPAPCRPDPLEHAAIKDLAAHLAYDTTRDSRGDLARWAQIRTREQIVVELRAAAAGLRAAADADGPDGYVR